MNRALLTFILVFSGFCARSQDALTAFTNRADQILRARWGFGVNEIPIYCSTNPLTRYNGGIHNCLQKAVDAYDATNHTAGDFDFPSVFRPQFAITTNNNCVTAIISNWVEVTTDYPAMMSRPFKTANDPTLAADDNVRGVGLVIGFKPQVPILSQFTYANTFNILRKLRFVRTQPHTRPYTTNQMYLIGLSNTFAACAFNLSTQALPRAVKMYLTNRATIILTNELGAGITNSFTNGNTQTVASNQWSPNVYSGTNMFRVLKAYHTNTLAPSVYSEQDKQFVTPSVDKWEFTPGLPVHSWFVNVEDQVVYALVDAASGRILDFVNFVNFGAEQNATTRLQQLSGPFPPVWETNGADSTLTSPPSIGLLKQIEVVTNAIYTPDYNPQPGSAALFTAFLNGTDFSDVIELECPYQPTATVQPIARWWVATDLDCTNILSPEDHFTIDQMPMGTFTYLYAPIASSSPFDPLANHGGYLPGMSIVQFSVDSENTTFQFKSYTEGQYGIWSSPDLINWSFVGLATKLTNYTYTLTTPLDTNAGTLFYEARKQ
jgi:hypothetical protein